MSKVITVNNCKNCGNSIETSNFCSKCGAKKITKRITFKNLFQEFVDRFFNLDNSFVKTFVHLFTKPEDVIDGYIHGLRKRYINAFGYFAISLTVLSLFTFLLEDRLFELITVSNTEPQAEVNKAVMDFMVKYQTILNFLSIPLLAIVSKIVFYNYKKYNFTEHLVIYLYAYSHIVAIISLLFIPITLLGVSMQFTFLQFPIYVIYIGYVLKRLYNLSFKSILLKTLLFFVVSFGLYFIISAATIFIMIITGSIDLEAFKPPSK